MGVFLIFLGVVILLIVVIPMILFVASEVVDIFKTATKSPAVQFVSGVGALVLVGAFAILLGLAQLVSH